MPVAIIPIIEALAALVSSVPSLVQAANTAITLVREQRDPTPAEQAQFDQALEDAVNATPSA